MEYDRADLGRPVSMSAFKLLSARGSWSSRESFREEEIPEGEEDSDNLPPESADEAREASSSESRGA